jgi:hypothetical protein
MSTLCLAALWVGVHLAAYGVGLRHGSVLRSEKGILVYHLASIAAFTAALAAGVLAWPGKRVAVGAVAMHGVYSMTFLCLWSSSQGGFALRVMQVLAAGPMERPLLEAAIDRWAGGKQSVRLAGLERARLLRRCPGGYSATRWGGLLAVVLRLMRVINHLERTG